MPEYNLKGITVHFPHEAYNVCDGEGFFCLISMLTADLLTGSKSAYAICPTGTARPVKRAFRGRHTSRYVSVLFELK